MNKEQIKKQNNFLLYFSIVVVIALIVSAIFILITPAEEKIIESDFVSVNYDKTNSEFATVNFSGSEIEVTDKLNIYRPKQAISSADFAEKIINSYELVANPDYDNYWVGENSSMIKRNSDDYYILQFGFPERPDEIINKDQAISTCLAFIKEKNLNLNVVTQENEILYLDNGTEQNIVNEEQAQFLQIPLTYELDSHPVFFEQETYYPIFCRVNSNYQVERFVFKELFNEFEAVKGMNSLSLDKAINNIKKGKASIIDANSQITSNFDLFYIKEANLYQVELEYRYDENLAIAYPFYHFKAKITNSEGLNLESDIITPAVNTAAE
jgi:hypothetical protein